MQATPASETRSLLHSQHGGSPEHREKLFYDPEQKPGLRASCIRFEERRPWLAQGIAIAVIALAGDTIAQSLEGTDLTSWDRTRTCRFIVWRVVIFMPLYTGWIYSLEWALPPKQPSSRPDLDLGRAKAVSTARAGTVLGGLLERSWRVTLKVLLDAFLWTPVQQVIFFLVIAGMEGRSLGEGWRRCMLMLPRTLPASWAFWMPVQFLTYGVFQPRHRVVWCNCVSLVWNIVRCPPSRPRARPPPLPAARCLPVATSPRARCRC